MRKSNIELLRIILIIYILGFHFISYGVFNPKHPIGYESRLIFPSIILESIFVIAVNCFVLVSGYFGIRNIKTKLPKLYFQVIFYSISISLIYFIWQIFKSENIDYSQLCLSVIPVISKRWWFFSAYIILMLISPILNNVIDYPAKKVNIFIAIGIFFLVICPSLRFPIIDDRGFGFVSFALLYICGGYIRKHTQLKKYQIITFYIISLALIVAYSMLLILLGKNYGYKSSSFAYNNIFVFSSAILFVLMFLKINLRENRQINRVATFVFGIYLFHEHPVIKNLLFEYVYSNQLIYKDYFYESLIIICLVLFILGCIFDFIRQKATERIYKHYCIVIDRLLNKLL